MRRTLQAVAVILAVAAIGIWIAGGAQRSWTKTSVPVRTVDEITGIEGITYQRRFVAGLDFLGGALLGAAALGGASLIFRNKTKTTNDNMKQRVLTLLAISALQLSALAEPQTFDFKDPKGVNNAVFALDAPLEAITGSANGVSGSVSFDPKNPGATKGKIVVAAATLHVPNPMMKEHMHGEQWMNVAKQPEITFEAKELKNVKTTGDNTTADAHGTLTLKGVTKEVTVPVKLTYLKDKLSQRVPQLKGDLLVIRSNFKIKRTDFGINPAAPQDKVSDEIEVTLSVAGAAVR